MISQALIVIYWFKQYVDLMQKKYITYWNHILQHSQKLNFYYFIIKSKRIIALLST